MKNKLLRNCICIALALALTALCCSCGKKNSANESTQSGSLQEEINSYTQNEYTDSAAAVKKAETVYVNMNSSGTPQSIIVSDWLHTDKSCVKVQDTSDLTNIINVKGLEQPIIDGKNVVWNMDSTDLYYRGYSEKQLPVEFKITYYLDGAETSPEELAGKSGTVTVSVESKNNISKTAKVDGKNTQIYCPFVVVGGAILNQDEFTDITLSGGKVISDGSKQIAMFVMIPGLKESLGLDSTDFSLGDLTLTDSATLTANVSDFSLGNMYFSVVPLSSIDAAKSLTTATETLEESLGKISDIINSIYSINADDLINVLMNNSDRISGLIDLINDAGTLYEENKKLIEVMGKYMTEENINNLQKLLNDSQNIDMELVTRVLTDESVYKLMTDAGNADLEKYKPLFSNPLFKMFLADLSTLLTDANDVLPLIKELNENTSPEDLQALAQDLNALIPIMSTLSKDMQDPEVQKSINNLPQTAEKLKGISSELKKNEDLINSLTGFLTKDNINKLTDIAGEVKNTSITSFLGMTNISEATAKGLVPRLDEMLKYAESYTIYSTAPENAETSVIFVLQTPGISK